MKKKTLPLLLVLSLLFVILGCDSEADNFLLGIPNKYYLEKVKDTGLPVIFIETENNEEVLTKEKKLNGSMTIVDGSETKEYELTIRVRGNATSHQDKKPYKIKLSEKAPLLGMKKNKDWALLTNYSDKTLMKTKIGFKVSELVGLPFTPNSRYVELFINGQYLGNYLLCETAKEGKNRVNIDEDEGFLVEDSKGYLEDGLSFKTELMGIGMCYKYPDWDDLTEGDETTVFISKCFSDLENTLYNPDKSIAFDPVNGYQKYIDIDSFAKWFITMNTVQNLDMNLYYYKYDRKPESKIGIGPVWDFDYSIGSGWYFGPRPNPNHSLIVRSYFAVLIQDDAFKAKVREIWDSVYPTLTSNLMDYYDELYSKLYESQKLNFTKWTVLDAKIGAGPLPLGSFDKEVECDKEYLTQHIEWFNNYLEQNF